MQHDSSISGVGVGGGLCRRKRRRLPESGLKVLVDGGDVGHDALPVRPLCVHHLVDVLGRRAPSTSHSAGQCDGGEEPTKVHLMPTLSAAWKARVKFLL